MYNITKIMAPSFHM